MKATSVIKTGSQCNNNCVFCIQEDDRYIKNTMSTEKIKEILKNNYAISKEVVLTGGEVTIRKDIFEIVKFAKKCGYKTIQIQSNGRMFFYIDFCKKLIDSGANEFGVSIHGSNAKIHDNLIGIRNGFEQVHTGLTNLKKLNQRICINTVITNINYKDLINIFGIVRNFEVYEYCLSFLYINRNILKDKKLIEEFVPRYNKIRPYVEEVLQKGIDFNFNMKTEAFPFCTLGEKYHSFVKKLCIPRSVVYEVDGIFNFQKDNTRSDIGKKKFEKCNKCKFYNICEGSWISYAKIFGSDEFIPIIKKNKI